MKKNVIIGNSAAAIGAVQGIRSVRVVLPASM